MVSGFLSISVVSLILSVTIILRITGLSISTAVARKRAEALICDVTIETDYEYFGDDDILDKASDYGVNLHDAIEEYVQINSYRYDESMTYSYIFSGMDVTLWEHHAALPETPIRFISISDYNRVLEFTGRDTVFLDDNSYLIN